MPPSPAPSSASVPALRALLGAVRHTPDRLLHPLRRRAALRMLAALGRPGPVVFVCIGNICRSPYAAGAFVRALPAHLRGRVEVESAGLVGPGRPSPDAALAEAAARGVELASHRSNLLAGGQARGAALVVVMAAEQRRTVEARFGVPAGAVLVLGDLDPEPITRRTVLDPWRGGPGEFRASYDRIDRCVERLARSLEPLLEARPAARLAGAAS